MTGHKYSRLDASPPPPPFPPSNKQKQAARQAVVDSTDLGVLSMLQVVPAYVAHESLDSVNLLIMWDSQSETLAQGTLSHVACQELARLWRATEPLQATLCNTSSRHLKCCSWSCSSQLTCLWQTCMPLLMPLCNFTTTSHALIGRAPGLLQW